ncbi:hypothetical protein O181_042004 [Austropuccinia psidii MF-1]|uniref:Uncharacterized protein n=1 Tax=Austropuccinia psidii MF-1 TaxID=1389203 RepID=A0A9Q3DFJ1_9BASI|nr:hypothetical protein [Austropuccinia psidii MF-1]
MLADKHTSNACLLSDPSDHAARGVPDQDALERTPLWSTMMKAIQSGNGHRDPKQADGNNSGQLPQSPQVLICPPPLLGHHQMVTSLLDRSEQPKFHLISTFNSSELTLPPFVEPSQTNEPPIPGPSPSSKPHEDVPTSEPEPEVAPTQSMEEPLARPTPPHSVIIINDMPVGFSLPDFDTFPSCSPSLHSYPGSLPVPPRTPPPPPPGAKLPSFPQ